MLQDQEIPASTASRSASAPSRTGSEACKPVSAEAAAAASRRSGGVEARRVQRERDDARRATGERHPLVELDELCERRDRMPRGALDLGRAGSVAEDEGVRRGAVEQAECDARVRRMDE